MDITSSQNNGLNVNSTNWSSGAGLIDDVNGMVKSIDEIKTAHGADLAATAVELALESLSTGIDAVAFALNPLAKLIAAGLGWLIEHVGVLTKALDLVAGDPDAIKQMADSLHTTATDMQNTATDMGNSLKSNITNWTGAAADAFTKTMTGHQDHIAAVGHAVDVTGYVVETNMALISALRNLIRDIITSTIADIISTFIVALATAPATAGASIVAAMGWLAAQLSLVGAKFAAKLSATVAYFVRSAGRLNQLGKAIEDSHPNIGHVADDVPHTTGNPGTRGLPPGTKTGPTETNPENVPNNNPEASTSNTANAGKDAPDETNPQNVPNNNSEASTSTNTGNAGKDAPNETNPQNVPNNDPNAASNSTANPTKPTAPEGTNPQGGGQTDISSANEPNPTPPNDHTAPTNTTTSTGSSTGGSTNYGDDDDAFKTWLAADDHFNGPHSNGEPSGSTSTPHEPSGSTEPSSAKPTGETKPSSAGKPDPDDDIVPNPDEEHAGVGDPNGKGIDTGEDPKNGEGSGTKPPEENKPQNKDDGNKKDDGGNKKPKAKDSPLKKFDAKPLKKHEDLLKNSPMKDSFDKSKFGENYLKNHHPKAFPYAKAIADAKSSKNYVGLAVKGDLQEAKQLTDIQARAEKAHEKAEEEYRKSHEHPDDPNFSGQLL